MTRKAVLVMLVLGLTTGFTIFVGQGVASAAGPIKLSGRDGWACPTGSVTMQFSPPLSAGAATTSSFTLTGTISDCYETGNTYQSHSATMEGFAGSISSNCSSLVGESAPPMSNGELEVGGKRPIHFRALEGHHLSIGQRDHNELEGPSPDAVERGN